MTVPVVRIRLKFDGVISMNNQNGFDYHGGREAKLKLHGQLFTYNRLWKRILEKVPVGPNEEIVSLIWRCPCGGGKYSQVTIESEEDVMNMVQTMVNIYGPNTNEISLEIIVVKMLCNYYDPLAVEESQFLRGGNNNDEAGTSMERVTGGDDTTYGWFENDPRDENTPYATTNFDEEEEEDDEDSEEDEEDE